MDRNKDVKMGNVLFCTAEELLKYLRHSGEKESPLGSPKGSLELGTNTF